MQKSGKLRQIGLGVQLRNAREIAGMSTRSVAAHLGLSPSSVNRNELGSRVPNREEVSALCVLYGVTGADKQALVERVGATSDANAWLSNASDQMASLMVLEREARAITNVEVTLVPGLVQTFEYARLVLAASCRSGTDLERQVADRLGRQAVLSKPKAPQVSLMIDEGALHRTLGNPRVLREQLEHLVVVQRRENVSIRVIPLEAEAHPALVGAYALYELVDGTSYVLMDGRSMGVFVSGSSDVAPFVEASRSLTKYALDERDSSALMTAIAGRFDDE